MNKYLKYILFLYLIFDIFYTFNQSLTYTIDGDLSDIVAPATNAGKVLKDPFGINTIANNDTFTGSNRFFIHWCMLNYFTKSPAFFQNFVSPIESVYVASAFFTVTVIFIILYLISLYVLGGKYYLSKKNLYIICLLWPIVHLNGYNEAIGITNSAVTYTFFYSFSFIGLLLLFLPFVFAFKNETILNFSFKNYIFLVPFSIFCAFSGPLSPPCIIIICTLLFVYLSLAILKNQSILIKNSRLLCLMLFIVVLVFLCFYSLFLGTFNQDNKVAVLSIFQRYLLLPNGLVKLFILSKGTVYLAIVILVNYSLLKRAPTNYKFNIILKWSFLFIAMYLLLLPLGGYRDYRPFITRNDTVLPIIILLFFLFAFSTHLLLKELKLELKFIYVTFIFTFIFINLEVDKIDKNLNICEKKLLSDIVNSNNSVVKLSNQCNVMDWGLSVKPIDSKWNAILFYHWGITKKVQLYYQE
jgi:hypothetical protein